MIKGLKCKKTKITVFENIDPYDVINFVISVLVNILTFILNVVVTCEMVDIKFES